MQDVSENEIKSSNADCKLKENPQRAVSYVLNGLLIELIKYDLCKRHTIGLDIRRHRRYPTVQTLIDNLIT